MLLHQDIGTTTKSQTIYRAVRGAGIGMVFAGAVSSAAFYVDVDSWLLRPGVQTLYKVAMYFRYEEDLLIVAEGSDKEVDLLIANMRSRPHPYCIE